MSIAEEKTLYHRALGPLTPNPHKRPVVLLHGLMGFSANWGKVWPRIEPERGVLVLDQRGHGKSFKPKTGYSPADYAQDLADLFDTLGWQDAHIVGHSMGGRVALYFCKLFPHLARSLVMEDSGAFARPERVDWINNLLAKIPTPFADRNTAKDFFERTFAHDKMTGSFLHMNLEPKENGSLDWRFHAPGMRETIERGRALDAMPDFVNLTLPTLLIRGGKSVEFPEAEALAMASARPGVDLVTIPDAGHFVHAEKSEEFCSILLKFLDRVDGAL